MFQSPTPTVDLYFFNSCKNLVAHFLQQKRPIVRLGDNTFQCGNRYLIIRNETEKVLHKVLFTNDIEIFYLIDDNIWDATYDSSLPEKYRTKLETFTSGILKEVIKRSEHFIVPSTALTNALPANTPVSLLPPCWHSTPPEAKHFTEEIIKIVHLGTNSHQAGYDFLQPILKTILDNNPGVSFTYYSNTPLLGSLDKHSRVFRKKLMRWKKYKKQIGKEHFHLGLYPILDTPFNRGRSHNKVLEYCLTGCAAIYSSSWNHSSLIRHGKNGWLCENDQQSWVDTILSLVRNPEQLQAGFQGASELFYQLNDLQAQRAFWKHLLLEE